MGSASSTSKVIRLTWSGAVAVRAATMFRWCSETTRLTSASRRERSKASTSKVARKTPSLPRSHSTSISRSWERRESAAALEQSARCTETPRPWVTNPTIWSPGTGVQHRARWTMTSSSPST